MSRKKLTDDTFETLINNTDDISDTFEINLGGLREDVIESEKEAEPFTKKVRELMVESQILPGTSTHDVKSGLIDMERWAAANFGVVIDALINGDVAAIDATQN